MPKTEIVYARLEFTNLREHVSLNEVRAEINERLYEVLKDDYYLRSLTQQLMKQHPKTLESWIEYRKNFTPTRGFHIKAIGKFEVTGQKVTLLDIKFY